MSVDEPEARTEDGPVTIAAALVNELDRRSISQRAAAEQLEVSQQTLSRWILGDYVPRPENVPTLAAFLRTSEKKVREMRGSGAGRRDQRDARRLDQLEAEVSELRRLLVAIAARVGVEP